VNESVADRLASNIDPDLLGCLRTQVNSFVKWDLVHFFHQNPYTIDTCEGIARFIGRNVGDIRGDLAALAAEGILVAHRYDGMTVYSYSDDLVVRDQIRRLMEACGDRLFRAIAAFQVLRAIRAGESRPAPNEAASDEQPEKSFVMSS
jgi:hypothetical protein